MAGVYLHIPFCKSRCIYCGFYSTTRSELQQRYVDALCLEMELRRDYLSEPVTTLYIGGGTPSLLLPQQLEQLFAAVDTHFPTAGLVEVTMECNPDDVTTSFVQQLRHLPVNRVSMGAQSFSDQRLRFLHRRHTARQTAAATDLLRKAGIENISIDLMYGFPSETIAEWHSDIDAAVALGVEHLSAYSLMYEEGTVLYDMLERGKVEELEEEVERTMYYDLIDRLESAGFEHYEISNFAKVLTGTEADVRGRRSLRALHNSSYWDGTPYLGLGAAAHSFDRNSRQWNVSDIVAYIDGMESVRAMGFSATVGQRYPCCLPVVEEREELNAATRYNDTVLTSLRTSDGLQLERLTDQERLYCLDNAKKYLADGLLVLDQQDDNGSGRLRLSRQGLFVSDMIMADLVVI